MIDRDEIHTRWVKFIEKDKWMTVINEALNTIQELERQLAQERWIPVSERLPEKEGDYLVFRVDIFEAEVCWFHNGFCANDELDIKYWKPINPPSEVSE